MHSDDVNNQVRSATEAEVMSFPARPTISDEVASYVAAMAERQVASLSQEIIELKLRNQISAVSASFSVTDDHGRQIMASASISFTQ